jgi:hypothetical protein
MRHLRRTATTRGVAWLFVLLIGISPMGWAFSGGSVLPADTEEVTPPAGATAGPTNPQNTTPNAGAANGAGTTPATPATTGTTGTTTNAGTPTTAPAPAAPANSFGAALQGIARVISSILSLLAQIFQALFGGGANAATPAAGTGNAPGATGPTTTGPTTTGTQVTNDTSSAPAAALDLLQRGIIQRGRKAFDGRLNLTQYGGPSDKTPDKYTRMGLGNRNNRLRATSLALSPDLIRRHGLRGGEKISIRTAQGTFFLGHYDDTTGNRNEPNVIDIYDPQDRLGQDNFLATIPAGQWSLVIG